MAEKKKRVSLTLKQKVNAIREVENNSTKSKGKIAEGVLIGESSYSQSIGYKNTLNTSVLIADVIGYKNT